MHFRVLTPNSYQRVGGNSWMVAFYYQGFR